MEGMDLKFTPAIGRCLLPPFKHVWAYGWHFWDPAIASPNSLNGRFNPPPASHPPLLLQSAPLPPTR